MSFDIIVNVLFGVLIGCCFMMAHPSYHNGHEGTRGLLSAGVFFGLGSMLFQFTPAGSVQILAWENVLACWATVAAVVIIWTTISLVQNTRGMVLLSW